MLSKSGRKYVETDPGKHVLKLVYFNTNILASIEDTAKAPMFEVQSAPQGLVSSFENYSFKYPRKAIVSYIIIFTLTVCSEFYWKCVISPKVYQASGILLAFLSLTLMWSEVTFFQKHPVLSIYAIFITEVFASGRDYFLIQVRTIDLLHNRVQMLLVIRIIIVVKLSFVWLESGITAHH